MSAVFTPNENPNLMNNLNYPAAPQASNNGLATSALNSFHQQIGNNNACAQLIVGIATVANLSGATIPTFDYSRNVVERPLNQVIEPDDPMFCEQSALLRPSELELFQQIKSEPNEVFVPRSFTETHVQAIVQLKKAPHFLEKREE